MSHSSDAEEVLARFLRDLDAAADPTAAVADYVARHADLAEQIRGLAALDRQLRHAGPAPYLERGRQLGPYRIERLIASGGMGEIYEAEEAGLQRRVAVKVIRQGHDGPEARARFAREARALARLHQTHIIPVHACGAEGGLRYFVMPFIRGVALHHVIAALREGDGGRGDSPTLPALAAALSEDGNGPAAGLPPIPPRRSRLSAAYFRSVADVLADAADALHHAHQAGVCHRDVKPSNLMVDRWGHCWIIDFGLAAFLGDEISAPGLAGTEGEEMALTQGLLGTPGYLAPERYGPGAPDPRSDVWALGATLYELLTLCRAYDGPSHDAIRRRVLEGPPVPAEDHGTGAPLDLAAAARKAMARDPAQRYQTAAEFAADLRRWRAFEPTTARPGRLPRRLALWARRNPGVATALAVALLALVTVAAAGWRMAHLEAVASRAGAREAEERERQRRLESITEQMQRLRLTPHVAGWAARAWSLGEEAARLRPTPAVRDQLVATRSGLDARRVRSATLPGVGAAVFGPGGRVLVGGYKSSPAFVWDLAAGTRTAARMKGGGPAAFTAEGVPVQLMLPSEGQTVVKLWDLAGQRVAGEWTLPGGASAAVDAAELSADGRLVAVASTGSEPRVTVWRRGSGEPVRVLDRTASALAFSPDGRLLAVGGEDGTVSVWPLPSGPPLAAAKRGMAAVRSLAFGPSRRRNSPSGWLLAAGDGGGTVTVWEPSSGETLCHLRGSNWDVHAVAFSPDGMTLASTGRMDTRLWDLATGRLLLTLIAPEGRNLLTGVSFSTDGRHLATSSVAQFGSPGGVDVWEIERGRGIKTLRGLAGNVSRLAQSPDGRLVAALSHGWEVGVWDVSGLPRLLHLFDAPRGLFADNAALTFSADGRQLAAAGGRGVRLWDLKSGKEAGAWKLPPGFQEQLAFTPKGLLSLRFETADGQHYPGSTAAPTEHPRVIRVRTLLAQGAVRLQAEVRAFGWHVYVLRVTPDGSTFLAEGRAGRGRETRALTAFTTRGRRLWSLPMPHDGYNPGPKIDPSGELLAHAGPDGQGAVLAWVESGRPLAKRKRFPGSGFGPGGRLWAVQRPLPPHGIALYRDDEETPLAVLDLDAYVSSEDPCFDTAGRRFVWGLADGSVQVCDLEAVRKGLEGIGLGW